MLVLSPYNSVKLGYSISGYYDVVTTDRWNIYRFRGSGSFTVFNLAGWANMGIYGGGGGGMGGAIFSLGNDYVWTGSWQYWNVVSTKTGGGGGGASKYGGSGQGMDDKISEVILGDYRVISLLPGTYTVSVGGGGAGGSRTIAMAPGSTGTASYISSNTYSATAGGGGGATSELYGGDGYYAGGGIPFPSLQHYYRVAGGGGGSGGTNYAPGGNGTFNQVYTSYYNSWRLGFGTGGQGGIGTLPASIYSVNTNGAQTSGGAGGSGQVWNSYATAANGANGAANTGNGGGGGRGYSSTAGSGGNGGSGGAYVALPNLNTTAIWEIRYWKNGIAYL